MGSEIRGSSGQLESVEGPGQGSGRCPGEQAEVGEDLRNDGGMFDACPEPIEGAAMIFKGPPQRGQCRAGLAGRSVCPSCAGTPTRKGKFTVRRKTIASRLRGPAFGARRLETCC
jgi:hypothetical protein